jgi:hypothetical protein
MTPRWKVTCQIDIALDALRRARETLELESCDWHYVDKQLWFALKTIATAHGIALRESIMPGRDNGDGIKLP